MPNNNPGGNNPYSSPQNPQAASAPMAPEAAAPATDEAAPATSPASAAAPVAGRGVSKRGFASMDARLQRIIASKGGHSQGRANNPGNFANDRERARIAGRKGGESHGSHR